MDQSPEIKYRKIDPLSKNEESNPVLSRMRELFAQSNIENQAFGSYVVNESYGSSLKLSRQFLEELRTHLANYRKELGVSELFSFIAGSQGSSNHIPGLDIPLALRSLLEEGLKANPHNRKGFQQALENSVPTKTEEEVTQFPNPEDVPDEDFIEMVKMHVKIFGDKQKELQAQIPQLKADFKSNVNEKLPIVSMDNLGFLEPFQILLTDDLLILLQERFGDCNVDKKRIRIAQSAAGQNLSQIFTHEALHAIAGRTVLETTETRGTSDETSAQTSRRLQKVGLGIVNRFRWLNEAVTEDLTILLITSNNPAYHNERQLLHLLSNSGKTEVPMQLFYDAYFENYDPALPRGERIPKWRTLTKAINEAYEPRFLVKLDEVVKKEGVKAGIDFVKAESSKHKTTLQQSPSE